MLGDRNNQGRFRKGHKGYKSWLGRKFSEEHKKKLRESHKGMLGKHHSLETKKKMSVKKKGERGSNWKGGITPIGKVIRNRIEYRLWREAVYLRDNYVCQECRKRGGRLNPHHVFNVSDYPKLKFDIENGITLCEDCHKLFHKVYGQRNNTKGQLEEFLLSK